MYVNINKNNKYMLVITYLDYQDAGISQECTGMRRNGAGVVLGGYHFAGMVL